jgi:ABC-type Fe3+-siderophore transport system permease subunit
MDYLVLRLGCSFLVGCLLSQSGSLVQWGTRNILTSPSTLGMDGLAIFWLMIFHFLKILNPQLFSNPFALGSGLVFFILMGWLFSINLKGKTKYERIILLGMTFNLMIGAVFSLGQFVFMAFNLPFPLELWFGHFRYASTEALIFLLLTQFLLFIGLKIYFKELKKYSIGSIMAQNWELNESVIFRFIFISVGIITFITTYYFGAFSFLALIFPILARKIWFNRLDLLGEFLYGAMLNGLLLMGADYLCYQYPIYGAELPVGIIITAIGALSLIVILWLKAKASETLAKPKK